MRECESQHVRSNEYTTVCQSELQREHTQTQIFVFGETGDEREKKGEKCVVRWVARNTSCEREKGESVREKERKRRGT